MLIALLMLAQAAGADTLATCHLPGDSQERVWILERDRGAARLLSVVFRSRGLDRPRVALQLPDSTILMTASEIRVAAKSANGGRHVEWRIASGPSTLDLYVNHGLEVNVDRDLDPAVDLMNTDGPIEIVCATPGSGNRDPGAGRANSAEWTASIGAARSVNLFQSTSGRSYAVQTIGWGKELTQEWGPGSLRGRFAWAVEAMPIFAQFSPSSIYGIGFAPVVWRWNFVPQPRWSAFAELSMGGMWSTEPIPEKTGRGNFTAHWGAGVRLRPRGGHALLVAYRFQHFSNGNQLGSNPGVNSHVVLLGWSYRS
jgi:hypothetical protein